MEITPIIFQWNRNYSIFSSEKYLQSISSNYGWLGGVKNGELLFVLPYIIRQRMIFRQLEFQTATIYIKEDSSVSLEKEFLEQVIFFLTTQKIDCIKQPVNSAIFATVPDQSISAPFGSYRVNLQLSEEELWSKIHSKHRNVIRRAEKDQVQIIRSREFDDVVYDLLVRTMGRSNMGFYSHEEYKKIVNGFGEDVEVFIAIKNGEPQGCAVLPYSQHSAYYIWGGSCDNPSLGAMNLLHWEAIKFFRKLDTATYDFVGARIHPQPGSKQETIQRFKERFGAEMKQGYLWKTNISSWKMWVYHILLVVKHKKIQKDIIDQERNEKDIFNL
jgi:hypothetical protein